MKSVYTVRAVKYYGRNEGNGIVAYVSHPTASSEKEAIDTAKMYANRAQTKGAQWTAELRRGAE